MENLEFNLQGKVINQNNKGIGNLIVVFYDTDRKLNMPKNYKKGILGFLEEKGSERLGSTYSKEDGSFKFTYEYKDFAPQKEEKRPDIIAVVLSPEEKDKTIQDRVLYFSESPLMNGGINESILIIINLPNSNSTYSKSLSKTSTIFEKLKLEEKEVQHLKAQFTDKISNNLDKHNTKRKESAELFKDISSVKKSLRDKDEFKKDSDDLDKIQKKVFEKGIAKLPFKEKKGSDLNITIKQGDFDEIGMDINLEELSKIEIPYNKYCGLIKGKKKGKELVKRDSPFERFKREYEIDDDNVNVPKSTELINAKDSGIIIPQKDASEFINDKLVDIYSPLQNSLDNQVLHDKIKTKVNFNQDVPPVDQKAYHDFHNLQIAFGNVWQELFDKSLKNQIKELYETYVDVVEGYNDSGKLDNDLKNTYNEIKTILESETDDLTSIISIINEKSAIVGAGIPIPKKLLSLGVDLENWEFLSIEQQNQIYDTLNNSEKQSYNSLSENEKTNYLFDIVKSKKLIIIKEKLEYIRWVADNDEWNGLTLFEAYDKGDLNTNSEHFISLISQNLDRFDTKLMLFYHPSLNFEKRGKSQKNLVSFSLSEFIPDNINTELIEKVLSNPKGIKLRLSKFIDDINKRLLESYSFHVFAPNSINYGILTTYRQEWIPSDWQVGDLVSTMPLTPGEKRKFSKKLKVKKTSSQKEVESSLSRRTDEATYTSKAHAEIFNKTSTATNFNLTVNGKFGFDVKVANGGVETTSTFKNDQKNESSAKKSSIRESTKKAANEYKNERSIEITSKEEYYYDETTSGEISNPNNEITVTYLFYELERQYKVSEELHKLTPVIMVAFDVPAPHEIDEDWLLTHEWILRRILLDDSFHEAFDYVREGFVADEINYEAAKGHYHLQKDIVEGISANVASVTSLKSRLQTKLNTATSNKNIVGFSERKRDQAKTDSIFGAIFNPAQLFLTLPEYSEANNSLNGRYDSEFYEEERKSVESRLNLVREELATVQGELISETNALEKAKDQMMMFTAKIFTKRNLVNQLRIHVKQNILYYMQGIWELEPPDQRFFRLYDKPAFSPEPADSLILEKQNLSNDLHSIHDIYRSRGEAWQVYHPTPRINESTKKLHELADLDNLLGFKGNFAIFPLKECTYITDYMMKDYMNDQLGIQDPDSESEFSDTELKEMYNLIKDKQGPKFEKIRDWISEILTARISNPILNNETIVVPTGQLYIEALPGKYPLLEDFKLKHREMDVLKVKEEVREAQIENLRKSARILNDDFEDADVDKIIKIDGMNDINLNE